jgi:membrane associated rhomboid family serine protease
MSNSIPLLFLGTTLFFFYNRIGKSVFLASYFIPNIFVWLFSPRFTYHIGASGIVYSLASFLIVIGFLKREFFPLLVSAAVILIYGGIFLYGLVPTDVSISWESHLGGALTGLGVAVYYHFKN